MRNLFLTLLVFGAWTFTSSAQTVDTYAGVANFTDPEATYDNSQVALGDAHFYDPTGIGFDSDGNMYITERNKIRMVKDNTIYNRSGTLGDPTFSLGYKNGTGNAAAYYAPTSAVCDANRDVFIVDSENHAVRKLTKFGSIGSGQIASTFAGAAPSGGWGTPGSNDGTGTAAKFNTPKGITLASNGKFYVTDYGNHTIREITAAGVVKTFAGVAGSTGTADGTGSNARFYLPYGIAVLDANNLVVSDYGNQKIRKVNINTGQVTTITGVGGTFTIKDGTLAQAEFRAPRGIAVVNGLIYVADENVIRVIDIANDNVSTFAGNVSTTSNTDGVGSAASFGRIGEVAYDGGYTLYVTDIYYNIVKSITIDDLIPVADFTATKTSLEVNEATDITDVSTGAAATSRTWTIKDVGGSSSNVEYVSGDPNSSKVLTVRFKAAGFYTVSLSITNDFGSDQVTKTDYINVSVTGSVTRLTDSDLLSIYPNPASTDYVNVSSGLLNGSEAHISILDMQGMVVAQYEESGVSNIQIPVGELSPGIYFVELKTEYGVISKKLIVR